MSQIGFVLLTHSKPRQIMRLVTRLGTMFDNPPIVIHHDFGKCALSEHDFPANVSFVRPSLNTGWGKFSVVEAIMRALTQLYRQPDAPEWCMLLSGACYPVKPAAEIIAELTAGDADAYISGRKIGFADWETDWHRERYERYCVRRVSIPSVDKRLRPKTRTLRLPDALGRRFLPFSDTFPCYAGSLWFTVNRKAAQCLIDFQQTPKYAALARYFRTLPFADEAYFQTVLYNSPPLTLHFGNLRYIDWSQHWVNPTGHPNLLTLSDLEAIQASSDQIARKIDLDTDSDLLEALDKIIDGHSMGQNMDQSNAEAVPTHVYS